MDIKIEDKGSCKVLLTVEVPYLEMKDDVLKIQRSVQQKAVLPGFRAGRAPWHLLEQNYGGTIDSEIKNQVVQTVYQKVLEEKDLHPVVPPVVHKIEYEKNNRLTFQMDVETLPKFELPAYTGIEIKKKKMNIEDKHVDEELKHLQDRHARFEVVEDRSAAMGDFVIVDYEIILKGKKEAEDQAKQVWIEIKNEFFIPKFCPQLVGLKKGEEKDIKVQLPKEYPKADLSGKKVTIHVKVNEIKRKVISPLNDEFAKEAANTDTLDELKTKIRNQLEIYMNNMVQRDMIGQIEEFLLKNTKLDVPPTIVSKFDEAIYQDTVSYLKGSGKASDEVIKEKESEIRTDSGKKAVEQVKLLYIMEEIAAKEKLDVTEEEINNRIKESAAQGGRTEKEIMDYLYKDDRLWNFRHKLRNEKLINFLLDKAEVKEVEASSK